MVHEALDTGDDMLARIGLQLLVGKQDDARTHDVVAGGQPRHGIAEPAHEAVGRQRKVAIAGGVQTRRTRFELERQRLLRSTLHSLGVRSVSAGRQRKPETG
ncbi:hypothetical protein D9M72_537250 [compost metagenome]